MEMFMKEILKMVFVVEEENQSIEIILFTKDNLNLGKYMDKEFYIHQTVDNIKEDLKMDYFKVRVYRNFKMALYMMECFLKIIGMGMEN